MEYKYRDIWNENTHKEMEKCKVKSGLFLLLGKRGARPCPSWSRDKIFDLAIENIPKTLEIYIQIKGWIARWNFSFFVSNGIKKAFET